MLLVSNIMGVHIREKYYKSKININDTQQYGSIVIFHFFRCLYGSLDEKQD